MNDGMSFKNTVRWRLFDEFGNLKDEGVHSNQTQNFIKEAVIDALDTGSCSAIITMAIGTGSGQGVSDTTLGSLSSYETGAAVTTTQSGTPEDDVEFSATFTAMGSWSIEEAGLFTSADGADFMAFYDDSISTSMSASDTLQIDWTVSVA